MQTLYNKHVVFPVDPNGTGKGFNYSLTTIRNDIVKHGKADFKKGYEGLTPAQVVSLYCYANMRLHLFESMFVFRTVQRHLKKLFCDGSRGVMFDIGCGPGTAALGLAESLSDIDICYVGMDRAQPMTSKAATLLKEAIKSSILPAKTPLSFAVTWKELLAKASGIQRPNVLINATCLFASETLNVQNVRALVRTVTKRSNVKNVLMVYINSNATHEKYVEFKKLMKIGASNVKTPSIEYYKNRDFTNTATARYPITHKSTFQYELLKFKGS